jgi:serine/threonine protein kinase
MIGQTISHYKILEKLGEGGMGVVYKAEDTKLKRLVALKFLPPGFTKEPAAKERFLTEAQAAAALNHSNIVTVYEIDDYEDRVNSQPGHRVNSQPGHRVYIAMEFVQGENLKEKIARGPLKIDEALNIAVQICEGLKEAHEQGVVHRDIKSANIMIDEKNQVKIMDFGLAKLKGQTKITKEGTTLGTAAYMSPEQARGMDVDHRTDLWSLGVVLYESITGQFPFKGEYEQAILYAIMNEGPGPVTGLRTGVPPELERIIDKTLAKDPGGRYQHADDLIVDLRKLKREPAPVSTAAAPKKTSKLPFIKMALAPAVLLAVLIVVGVVGAYFLFKGEPGKPVIETRQAAATQWQFPA